jgi:hypothetical protein
MSPSLRPKALARAGAHLGLARAQDQQPSLAPAAPQSEESLPLASPESEPSPAPSTPESL